MNIQFTERNAQSYGAPVQHLQLAASELDENKQAGSKKHWHSFKSRGRFPLEADEVRHRQSFTAQKTRVARADAPLPRPNVTRCFIAVVCGVLFRLCVRQLTVNTSSGGSNHDSTLCCGILVLLTVFPL